MPNTGHSKPVEAILKYAVTKQFWLTSIIYFDHTMEVNQSWTFWLLEFFKISSFVFHWRKKVIQFWNNLRVGKWWLNLHFLVIDSFSAWLLQREAKQKWKLCELKPVLVFCEQQRSTWSKACFMQNLKANFSSLFSHYFMFGCLCK